MAYEYINTLNGPTRTRYQAKLAAAGLDDCPYRLPADIWKEAPTCWPSLEFGDIYTYLINSPGPFTQTAMKNYKSLEAHNFFRAGWVQTVRHLTTSKGNFIFRAGVKPSQKVNNAPHNPWLAVNEDGGVITAHCDCMAGLGESCSHVAAVLFKIEAAGRLGYTTVACTDVACKWNQSFVSDVQPSTIGDIEGFYRQESLEGMSSTIRPTGKGECPDVEKENFLQDLMSCKSKPVGLSLFSSTCDIFVPAPSSSSGNGSESSACASLQTVPVLPRPLSDLYDPTSPTWSTEVLARKCDNILENMSILPSQNTYLTETTISQGNSLHWHQQRIGRVTASRVYDILHTNQEKPSVSLLSSLTDPNRREIFARSLEYGRQEEIEVFEMYSKNLEWAGHINAEMSKVGMRIAKENPWLSASADAFLKCDFHGRCVIEIKSPYTFRHENAERYLADCRSCLDGHGKLKHGHKYFDQIQIQMFVYEVETCIFIVSVHDSLLVDVVKANQAYIAVILPKLRGFWKTHILPELLTRKLLKNNPQEASAAKDIFCYCRMPYDANDDTPGSDMVGCDGAMCPYKWVHLRCIRPKRTTFPKGAWYCKDCRKEKSQK